MNVVLTLTTQPNAIVVPTRAIQTGQQGQYVFVVRPDFTVEIPAGGRHSVVRIKNRSSKDSNPVRRW